MKKDTHSKKLFEYRPLEYTSIWSLWLMVAFLVWFNVAIWDTNAQYIVAECPNNKIALYEQIGWYKEERALHGAGRNNLPHQGCDVWEHFKLADNGAVIRIK